MANPLKNIGALTGKDGTVVKTKELNPTDRKEVEWRAGMRDLSQMAGNDKHQKEYQDGINKIYATELQRRLAAKDKK